MKTSKLIKGLGLSLSCLSLAMPTAVKAADTAAPQQSTAPVASTLDVTLADGGVLVGHVVNEQGVAKADAQVAIYYQSKTIASTKTDANGRFVVGGLREGSHQIATGDQVATCRFWSTQTAPPSAKQGVMFVENRQVARGQNGGNNTGYWLVGGAVTAIVVGGLVSQDHTSGGGGGGGSSSGP